MYTSAHGATIGILFNAGDGFSSVPIYGSYCLLHAVIRFDLASDLTKYLQKIVSEYDGYFFTTTETEMVVYIKEKLFYVVLELQKRQVSSESEQNYTLQVMKIGSEVSSNPKCIYLEQDGMQLTFSAVMVYDIDIKKNSYDNLGCSGAATIFEGTGKKSEKEVRPIAPASMTIKLIAPSKKYRVLMTVLHFFSYFGGWIAQCTSHCCIAIPHVQSTEKLVIFTMLILGEIIISTMTAHVGGDTVRDHDFGSAGWVAVSQF